MLLQSQSDLQFYRQLVTALQTFLTVVDRYKKPTNSYLLFVPLGQATEVISAYEAFRSIVPGILNSLGIKNAPFILSRLDGSQVVQSINRGINPTQNLSAWYYTFIFPLVTPPFALLLRVANRVIQNNARR